MFDFWRDRNLTAADKRLETLSAYLDDALPIDERERFEAQLSRDDELRVEVEHARALQMQMQAMLRRRVPRSFVLDPALYGRPKSQPLLQAYPFLRGATALAAVLLIFTLSLGAFSGQFTGGSAAGAVVPQAAMVAVVEQAAAETESIPAAASEESLDPASVAKSFGEPGRPSAELSETAEYPELQGDAMAAPPAEATSVAEDSGLAAASAAGAGEPSAAAFAAGPAPSPNEATGESMAVVAAEPATAMEPAIGGASLSSLWPIQIGLAAVFLLLLALWLIARRRARTL